jgi:hypothetical protein
MLLSPQKAEQDWWLSQSLAEGWGRNEDECFSQSTKYRPSPVGARDRTFSAEPLCYTSPSPLAILVLQHP